MPKIEIDLADLGLPTGMSYPDGEPTGAQTLQDLIVQAAADRLIGSDYELKQELRGKVMKQFNDQINAKVAVLVEEAFDAPVQRTTTWGETQGEPTTVRELIRESIEKYLKGRSDRNSRYGSSSSPAGNLGELIDDAVKQAMTADLKKAVDEAKKQVHEKVTEAALKAAVDVLNK